MRHRTKTLLLCVAGLLAVAGLSSCAAQQSSAPRNIRIVSWYGPTQDHMKSETVIDNDGRVLSHREWERDGTEIKPNTDTIVEPGSHGPKPRDRKSVV